MKRLVAFLFSVYSIMCCAQDVRALQITGIQASLQEVAYEVQVNRIALSSGKIEFIDQGGNASIAVVSLDKKIEKLFASKRLAGWGQGTLKVYQRHNPFGPTSVVSFTKANASQASLVLATGVLSGQTLFLHATVLRASGKWYWAADGSRAKHALRLNAAAKVAIAAQTWNYFASASDPNSESAEQLTWVGVR